MPSKYAALKGKYPMLQMDPKDSASQKILKLRRELDDKGRKEVQELFKKLRYERDELKEAAKENYARLQACQMYLLDYVDEEDIQQWKDDDGYTYRDQPEPYCSVNVRSVFDAWAEEHGWKDLYTINFQTLNAAIKPMLLNNEEPPPGVEIWMKRKIVLTKPR